MSQWAGYAHQWQDVGSPLRPSREDVEFFAACRSRAASVLILGVTPEIVDACRGIPSVVADRSQEMINHVMPGGARAIVADWRRLPMANGSFDLVVGDGSFTQLEEHSVVFGELARVLVAGGILAHRFFVRPDVTESLDAVWSDFRARSVGSFHALKWRIAMALADADGFVDVRQIRDAIRPKAPACTAVWPAREVATIELYQALMLYWFPTMTQLRRAITSAGFRELRCETPTYELGDRCPRMLLERTHAA